jgi:2-desacetyl-2-hydroxyethyl bacteriochlorophyllide A dehydrogenase
MKAIVINQFGTPDVLKIQSDIPTPSISSDQVLIKIYAAGINPLDWKIRQGDLKFILGSEFPMVLGNDASGVIVEVGSAIQNFKIGDEVYCLLDTSTKAALTGFAKSGAYAQMAVTREDTLSLKPKVMTHSEAASVPLAALTAYQALHYKAKIKSGDKVLINGASGGVGIFATQLAKLAGANVTAVCSEANTDMVTSLGADIIINYKSQKVTELDGNFDIIYDIAGSITFSECKKRLTSTGVFISNLASLANMLSSVLYPITSALGFKKKNTFAWVKSSGKDLTTISKLINNGQLTTVIDGTYKMEEIKEAHFYSQSGRIKGKIVLDIIPIE